MFAEPTYPYNVHSVWNRNQLGSLNLSDPTTLAMIAIAGWLAYKYVLKGKLAF